MVSTLYSLTGEMMELLAMLNDPDTDNQIIEDTLEGVQFELEKKAENYVMVIRQLESDAKALKEEKERLDSLNKTLRCNICYNIFL